VAQKSISEFALIERFFKRDVTLGPGELGIGDDCALINIAPGETLALSADMLVSGRHFFPDVDPYALGWKALAVNLSDLAAMGATPRHAMLSLALPKADPAWLEAFAKGFFALADEHGVSLIGGDTTKGPLNISIQIMGTLKASQAKKRSAAKVGDDIWISGDLGTAMAALYHRWGKLDLSPGQQAVANHKMQMPRPRVALGLALAQMPEVHAAIDISDGLVGDLGHILKASQVGAALWFDRIPKHDMIANLKPKQQALYVLGGGDEYELCFTALPSAKAALQAQGCTAIGRITSERELLVYDDKGAEMSLPKSFDHFN
jgi:thiamine-monophosphate kinase